MLQRVRAILLQMQLAGDPELVDVKVGEVSRYCWKISGTTAMLAQKKDKAMITGQGRWGLCSTGAQLGWRLCRVGFSGSRLYPDFKIRGGTCLGARD